MTFSSFWYLAKQGLKSMVANRMMTIASIGILTACLFVTGAATLLSLNINQYADYLVGTSETVVYLWDTKEQEAAEKALAAGLELPAAETETPYDPEAVKSQLLQIGNIQSYVFVTKEEALKETYSMVGEEYAGLLSDYQSGERANPIPASFRIKVKDLRQVQETAAQLRAIEGVQKVDSPNELAVALINVKDGVNYAGWGLVAILGVVGLVIIANTIRLTVFARHKEINIMKFVGATNTFIRMPFFIEGIAVGLVSALLAFALLSGGYALLMNALTEQMAGGSWMSSLIGCMIPYKAVWAPMLGWFCLAGAGMGGLGSAFSIRRHLKV